MALISRAGWMLVTTTRPRLDGEGQRLGHQLAVADAHRHDDLVGHRAPGDLLDEREGLVEEAAVWVAPNSIAFSRLQLDRVDGDDPLGTGEAGALDGVGADAADADDGDGVARLDIGGVDGRAPTGDHATAEQAGLVERDVGLDLDAAGLVDDRVVAERAEQAHEPQVLALGVVA